MNEQEIFLKGIEEDANGNDPFADIEGNEPEKDDEPDLDNPDEGAEADDDDEPKQKPRNRRERRLLERLEAERQNNIQMADRLEAITAAQSNRTEEPSEYLKAVERIYGSDSPEAREATEILKAAIIGAKEDAKREALEAYETQRTAEQRELQDAEATLDEMLYDIEDEFDVDFASPQGTKAQVEFFKLMEKMSPKDREGNILYYADHISVWEEYQERSKKAPDPTAKKLSSRSMRNGASADDNKLQSDTTERFLRDNGII